MIELTIQFNSICCFLATTNKKTKNEKKKKEREREIGV